MARIKGGANAKKKQASLMHRWWCHCTLTVMSFLSASVSHTSRWRTNWTWIAVHVSLVMQKILTCKRPC